MRQVLLYLFLTAAFYLNAQTFTVEKIDSVSLDADFFYGADEFGFLFYKKNDILYKEKGKTRYVYQNVNLGTLSSVSIQNPFKIILFYKDYNSIVILDNRLNELLDPVTVQTFNVTLAGYAPENNVWLYSEDHNTLQLFDYFNQKINLSTQPLGFYQNGFSARELTSDNDNVWLTGQKGVLQFNQYASFIESFYFENISSLQPYKKGFFFIHNDKLHFFNGTEVAEIPINLEHTPGSFYIRNGKIYIFSKQNLSIYSLKE